MMIQVQDVEQKELSVVIKCFSFIINNLLNILSIGEQGTLRSENPQRGLQ